jgi:hypothetical protein
VASAARWPHSILITSLTFFLAAARAGKNPAIKAQAKTKTRVLANIAPGTLN